MVEDPSADCGTPAGGKIMRHYTDGRVVDVRHWKFADGANIGCENSTIFVLTTDGLDNCRGISYIFHDL